MLYALELMGPLVNALRIVNGKKTTAMGYIYEAIDRAKEEIATSFGHKEELYKRAFEIIDERWKCQLHYPLYAARHFLNPSIYYSNPNIECERVMKGLYDCIARMVPETKIQDKILQELQIYKKAEGLFGIPLAIRSRERKLLDPAGWWSFYGASAPNLRRFAIRILSLTCPTTGCEKNLGLFQNLHTKKRNRLAQSRVNDLVFVKFNRALAQRDQNTTNPVLLKNINESNEWLLGRMDGDSEDEDGFAFEGNNLTWGAIARASGAHEPSRLIGAQVRESQGSSKDKGKGIIRAQVRERQGSSKDKGKGIAPTSASRNSPLSEFSDELEEEEDVEEEDIGVSGDDGMEEEEDFVGSEDDEVGDDVSP